MNSLSAHYSGILLQQWKVTNAVVLLNLLNGEIDESSQNQI